MAENAAGGGNAQGGADGGGGGEPDPKLVEAVAAQVTKALDLDRKIGGAVANQLKKIDIGKQIADGFAALKTQTPDGGEPDGGEKGKPPQVDPKLLESQRKIADQEKRLAKMEAERDAAIKATQRKEAVAQLQSAFGKHGVRPEAVDRLTKAYLADVTFDEEGNPLLPIEGGTTTIAAAIEAEVKSKALDYALPPPNAGGAGSARRQGTQNGGIDLAVARAKPQAQRTPAETDAIFQDNLRRQTGQV